MTLVWRFVIEGPWPRRRSATGSRIIRSRTFIRLPVSIRSANGRSATYLPKTSASTRIRLAISRRASSARGKRSMAAGRTMFDKIWSCHVVVEGPGGQALLYIDRHLLHEGSVPAFQRLRRSGRPIRRPAAMVATADHYVPTANRGAPIPDEEIRGMEAALHRATGELGITYFSPTDARQGIVHVIGPEQGLTQPGITLICGDSHTATHGALGALAFGIGSSEVEHVMATQCLWQRKPKVMRVTVTGTRAPGIAAKDVVLAIIARLGAGGGVGHAIEYAGSAIP